MKNRRQVEAGSLSFLDCICCGFGAIILLLVLSKTAEPFLLESSAMELEGLVAQLEQEIFELRGEARILNRTLTAEEEQLSLETTKLARLQRELSKIRGEFQTSKSESAVTTETESKLAAAKQELTEEMRRLLGEDFKRKEQDKTIAGVPVDSEYIIFIIDTSGSMFEFSWDLAVQKVEEVLSIYPRVKGIQVMNDMGNYMFTRYRGRWMPDSPERRRAIVQRMRTWNVFSNSSPVEGITRAIQTFYAPDKKISLYVFGDEFTGSSIEKVVNTVDRINKEDQFGNRLVRIHAVGFPVQFIRGTRLETTGTRFATLMRILCERNQGTFVGLDRFTPSGDRRTFPSRR